MLGITLDDGLSFHQLITSVVFSSIIFVPSLTSVHSSYMTASTLARCLVLSRLDYCNPMLHNTTQHQQTRLQQVMNKAARVVQNINTPDHYLHHSSKSCLIQLHWLPVQSRITFKTALLTFKSLSTSTPAYLCNLIQQKPHTKILPSSTAPLLKQQPTTNNISKPAFRNAFPAIWNSLLPTMRNSITISSFESELETYSN